MKYLLATAAVLALTSVSATGAERYQPNEYRVPPAEYDKPFAGKLEEFIINDLEELKSFCGHRWVGCAIRHWAPSETVGLALHCSIYLLADEPIRKYGWTIEMIRRHEIAHCNGWVHPDLDLPKIDPWSLKVSKPE
jgi:hypothetical protein